MPHTSGQWKIQTYTNYLGWSVWAGDRGCIAERWYDKDQESPYRDELLANARLIAAAPDLLAACEAVLSHPWEDCREQMEKAVENAKGAKR